ncbi:MAG: hypothetical protein AAGA03_13625, partial [Planctomycetota bacterium]
PIANVKVVRHSGGYNHLDGSASTNEDGVFEMHVRDWAFNTRRSRTPRFGYWAILDRPAMDANPPQFTKLEVIDNDPDALILQRN